MPNMFTCPSKRLASGLTTYEIVVDSHSMFPEKRSGVLLSTVTDGTPNTLLVVESKNPVFWSKPDDLRSYTKIPCSEWVASMLAGLKRRWRTAQSA
jgi:hypothetical protein